MPPQEKAKQNHLQQDLPLQHTTPIFTDETT